MQAPKFSRRSFLKSGAVAAAAASLPGFSLPAAAAAAPIGTVCQTQHGPVQGIRQEGHLVWYGIPYGASTAGDARWTAPQDPAPWADAKDCTVPGAAAYLVQARDHGASRAHRQVGQAEPSLLQWAGGLGQGRASGGRQPG